jgi:hypothetical protein
MVVFTEDMYNSRDGMLTSVWGPAFWHVLHTISFNYPPTPDRAQRKAYYRFIKCIGDVLPCGHCRRNYVHNLIECGFGKSCFRNRHTFSKFVFDLHNHVNSMLNKTTERDFNRVRKRYENFRSRCVVPPEDVRVERDDATTERGCVDPMYGTKSKCVIRIVPKQSKHRPFAVHRQCRIKRRPGPMRSSAVGTPHHLVPFAA